MAIYTQYGRYQKAKLFKEMLESYGDTYMLLGLGNPYWDDATKDQSIPVAPYDTSMINPDPAVVSNQFLDGNINQYFCNTADNQINPPIDDKVEHSLIDGRPNLDAQDPSRSGKYLDKVKDLVPPFPCIWQHYNYSTPLLTIGGVPIYQDSYQDYYITSNDNYTTFELYSYSGGILASNIQFPTNQYERQFFSELVLRGFSLSNCSAPYLVKHPSGFLGCVRCGISFVKDIGTSIDLNYTGSIDQFWYGDRYWEVVDPNETTLDSYIDGVVNKVYPHHLLFSATINPRQLFAGNLNIDQNLIPREVAIFSKSVNPLNQVHGRSTYRVGEYIFNFGQYNSDEAEAIKNVQIGGESAQDKVLNFTFPCTVGNDTFPQGEFKFILNDYIKGTVRNRHSVDRIGYIVGF